MIESEPKSFAAGGTPTAGLNIASPAVSLVSQAGGFRLASRYVFLTYARCEHSKEDVGRFLESLGAASGLVAQELHEDGYPHLHAVIDWGGKKNVKDPRKFDYEGIHPNIQAPRNVKSTEKYCRKEDCEPYVWGSSFDENALVRGLLEQKTRHAAHMYLLEQIGMHPRFNTWMNVWDARPREVTPIVIEPKEWWSSVPKEADLITEGGRPRALWLKGPPESGKTRYVENEYKDRSLFYVSGPKGFQGYNGEDVLVFDDICSATWQNHVDFLKRVVTEPMCRTPAYYGTHDLAWPRLVIVTCNNLTPEVFSDAALTQRFLVYDVRLGLQSPDALNG